MTTEQVKRPSFHHHPSLPSRSGTERLRDKLGKLETPLPVPYLCRFLQCPMKKIWDLSLPLAPETPSLRQGLSHRLHVAQGVKPVTHGGLLAWLWKLLCWHTSRTWQLNTSYCSHLHLLAHNQIWGIQSPLVNKIRSRGKGG